MSVNEESSNFEMTKQLISHSAEIAGTAVGGAFGFFAAGPLGASAGSVGGLLLTKGIEVAAEFALRDLSRRERLRVGAGLAFAYTKISQYLKENRHPRSDDFFERDINGRSASEEILEGVLFKCKNEHEEKKIRLLGNIYANTAFLPEVLPAGANWLLQKAEELTYRQMCILSLVKRKNARGASWGPKDGDPAFEMEYKDLENMFIRDSSPQAMRLYEETGEGRSILGLSRVGAFCYEVMGLEEIPEDDLHQLLGPRFPRAFRDR